MSSVLARPLDTRTIALSVAGVLAVGTGVLTYNYLASVGHANAPVAKTVILVAAKKIPAHAVITAEMLARTTRPSDAVDPDAIMAPALAIGSVAANEIPAGSALTQSKLIHYTASGLPGRVHVGMRAVAIALDRVKGVSNLIQAGDKVDVIATTLARGDQAPKSVTIIRGATVLSVGTMTDPGATPSPDGTSSSNAAYATATLEVNRQQADLLALADVNTMLRLALRSPKESLHSAPAEKLTLTAGQAAPATRPMAANPLQQLLPSLLAPARPPVAQATPVPKPTVAPVAVIEGDRVVQGAH
ncbi:MAG TPA: Flp pilus assembly protein CpaB [Candidatus Elarobacter sp.]|jgi:pilus assembly protein CpaB|nr:Flp pilus assembly protein CpaB [Candidatus Elarobacter sp.]